MPTHCQIVTVVKHNRPLGNWRCRVPQGDIEYCECRIAEEERLARIADSEEAGLGHSQLAMLYRSQLTALYRSLGPEEHRF